MENQPFRVAVVGCGTIAPNHLFALSQNDDVRVVALVDPKTERAVALQKEFAPEARIFADYEEMLRTVHPDSVHICTPHYLHAPMAIRALSEDIHVFLEKPMCRTEEEIPLRLEAAKKSKGKITVSFQNRLNPTTLTALQIAKEDGGVLRAYGTLFWDRDEKYYTESGWRGKRATEGGGVLINQAIHTLDLLCLFLGRPKTVIATTANHHLKGIIDVEDSAEGRIDFADGGHAGFYATTSFAGDCQTTAFLETAHHRMEIRSSDLYLDGKPYGVKKAPPLPVGKECYGSGHIALIDRFYEAIRAGEDTPIPPSEAQWALRILLAAYRSFDNPVEI